MAEKNNNQVLMAGDRGSNMSALRKVMRVIGGYKFLLSLSTILAAGSAVLQLYVPILFGRAIDGIVAAHRVKFDLVSHYLGQILLLVLLVAGATWLMNLLNNQMTFRIIRDIRSKAIRQIQLLPVGYLDSHSNGDIVSRVITDTDQLSDGLLLGFTQLFSGVVTIIATLIFMFSVNWQISILVVVLTPLSFFVARFIANHSYQMFNKQTQTRGQLTGLIEEMVGGARVVKAFGSE